MNRLLLALFAILFCNGIANAQENRPNIVWINCDDLGREVGCYGNTDLKTPNLDKLAKEGVMYANAYANAPVCSASRSSQITGCYPSFVNCLNHRTMEKRDLPHGVVPVMELFQKAGYFCTNGWAHNMNKAGKEDYNFQGSTFFDGTDWAQRAEGQPFFAQVQIHEPHRTFHHDKENPIDYNSVTLPSCYPDYPVLRADWALYLEMVQKADRNVGLIIDRLEKEGLLENTIVIAFGDHGRPHLRDKQWLYEGGLQIPMIVRWPNKQKAGKVSNDLISLVDVTASSLALAGIDKPSYMHGKNVLGGEKREYVFGFRARCGDADDEIRSVCDGRYKLIWNQLPELPYMQLSSYKRLQYPAFTLYRILDKKGELKAPYNQFMRTTRPEFEFYDLKNDPNEFHNLADSEKCQKKFAELKDLLTSTIAVVEKDRINESAEATAKGQQGSLSYFQKSVVKRGLSADVSDEELMEFWYKDLGVKEQELSER